MLLESGRMKEIIRWTVALLGKATRGPTSLYSIKLRGGRRRWWVSWGLVKVCEIWPEHLSYKNSSVQRIQILYFFFCCNIAVLVVCMDGFFSFLHNIWRHITPSLSSPPYSSLLSLVIEFVVHWVTHEYTSRIQRAWWMKRLVVALCTNEDKIRPNSTHGENHFIYSVMIPLLITSLHQTITIDNKSTVALPRHTSNRRAHSHIIF